MVNYEGISENLKWLLIFRVGFWTLILILSFILYRGLKVVTTEVLPLPIENVVIPPKVEPITNGLPNQLKIPSINAETSVEKVGILPDGTMDTPKSPDDVAWFEPGIRPGDIGSAVIVGHYGKKNGKGSVFDNIDKLKPGDKLSIEDDKGATINFIMRETRLFNPKEDSTGVFISNDGKSHLNLITCEGIWNKILKGYPKRLVVFTDKE